MRATSGQLASKFALDCILAIFAFACPEPPEFLLFGAMITMNEECPKRLGQIPPRPRISKKNRRTENDSRCNLQTHGDSSAPTRSRLIY